MRMPHTAKEIVSAGMLESPEMFVKNSLGDFYGRGPG
jgi:hypothetical protein